MEFTKNDQFCDPTHPRKLTVDVLFKNDRIRKYVVKFKTPPFHFHYYIIHHYDYSTSYMYGPLHLRHSKLII